MALVYAGGNALADVAVQFRDHAPKLRQLTTFTVEWTTCNRYGWVRDTCRHVLVFSLGKYTHPGMAIATRIEARPESDDPDQYGKRWHPWGQDFNSLAMWVKRMTRPGDLVVDPFLGGGTTPAVCQAIGHRRCIAGDIDQKAVDKSLERLALTRPRSYREGKQTDKA